MTMRSKLRAATLVAVLMLALPACGPGEGDVSGIVTYQKKPVCGCTITFFDEHRGAGSAPLKEGGSYTVPNVKTGTAKIVILMPLEMSVPGMPVAKFTPVPVKYVDAETSGLTYQVKRGPQTHNIELD
jgi:hypothetical protein